jgi:hypothetical protein
VPTHHQTTSDTTVTTRGLGSADTATIKASFPASPINSGEYTAAAVAILGQELLQGSVVNDGGHTYGTFNRDYIDAPELSMFVPNPGSPGPGSTNPADIPEPPDNWPPPSSGAGSSASPSETSTKIATQTIGSLISGRSYTG